MPSAPSNGPLSPAAFHILVVLAAGKRHGYGIMKEVAAATSDTVKLNPGTLYTTIKRLLEDEFIRETSAPSDADSSDDRRRYYSITPLGRRAAEAELARLDALIHCAAATLRTKPVS